MGEGEEGEEKEQDRKHGWRRSVVVVVLCVEIRSTRL